MRKCNKRTIWSKFKSSLFETEFHITEFNWPANDTFISILEQNFSKLLHFFDKSADFKNDKAYDIKAQFRFCHLIFSVQKGNEEGKRPQNCDDDNKLTCYIGFIFNPYKNLKPILFFFNSVNFDPLLTKQPLLFKNKSFFQNLWEKWQRVALSR